MARRLHRTGGMAQVTPDALLARRTGAPCSLDVPVSVARQRGDTLLSMFGDKGRRSVFDAVQIDLTLCNQDAKIGAPRLVFDRKIYSVNTENEDLKASFGSTSLFTVTTKMACPSFSLPAGPTTEMGSCPAANQSKKGGLREQGRTFVCDGCYSLESNYVYANVAIAQAARLFWVRRHLKEDPSGVGLGQAFVTAIDDYARNATLSASRDGVGSRLVLELGTMNRGHLVVPVRLPSVSGTRLLPVSTPLPPDSGYRDTDDYRAQQNIPEGAVCGFFRIHDSGDYGVMTTPASWRAYANAWKVVAESLPHVHFWAPTRMWVWEDLMKSMAPLPPNLSVRPSALHVDDEAPVVESLVAGSTVLGKPKMKQTVEGWTGAPGETWACPVYSQESADDKSCLGSGCRACWLWKKTPVAYKWH